MYNVYNIENNQIALSFIPVACNLFRLFFQRTNRDLHFFIFLVYTNLITFEIKYIPTGYVSLNI